MSSTVSLTNHQVCLARRPVGPTTAQDWSFTTEAVPRPAAGGVLIRTLFLSLDPAMRGWMNDGKSYIAPVGIGEVMRAGGIGEVLESSNPKFAPGDLVSGSLGVQEYVLVEAAQERTAGLHKIDTRLGSPTQWLNVLGMPGMTGYFGLMDVGQPKAGETVVVSGAAKCEWVVRELGFDACIDYKAGNVKAGLKEHCPKGVDVYFDNVGGDILDDVLTRISRGARIIICGAISQYNNTTPVQGPKNYLSLLVNRARMEGIVVFDYVDRFPVAIGELAGHLKQGRMKSREDVMAGGIAAFPQALAKLFTGENFGKMILQVADA
jgi:NADPH-dependent curcumin reductase CurA